MIYIYALAEPETGEIRYIGKSVRPRARLADHCRDRSVTHRTNWLREVCARGQRPALVILEELPDDGDWQAAERRWIAQGRAAGWHLTNCTSGGDGVPDLPEASRQRIAATWLGRKHSEATKAKIGASSRTRRHTQAHRAHMSRKMSGRQFSAEWRQRIGAGVSKLSEEQVRAIRAKLAAGVSQYVIAAEFSVHQGTISNIKRGLSYADVV